MLTPILTAPAAATTGADHSELRRRVNAVIAHMTLEEKIGQMTQLTVGVLAAHDSPLQGTIRLDPARLRDAIVTRHVGSVLNILGGALTVDSWRALVQQLQDVVRTEARLPIPILYAIDAVHGANYTVGGTLFPHNIGMAATFDPELVRKAAHVTAAETHACAQLWNFAPVLDVARHPAWPRLYETFGEDACVATVLGRAAVEGIQETGRIAATAKHFLGYGAPRSGRDRTPSSLTRREVREQILPPFQAAIDAGVLAVMVSSGEIDGEPVHASRYWLTQVLREELGFDGVVISDWADISFLQTRHRVAATLEDAVHLAINAGVDVSMTPDSFDFADALADLVCRGAISVSRIDESVARVLMLKARLGLFRSVERIEVEAVGSATSAAVAMHAARASITLLKNDGTLPLRRNARILVTGPGAASLTALNGGWTNTWQGNDPGPLAGSPTLLEEIRHRAARVDYIQGATFTAATSIADAAIAAAQADAAVVVLGEDAYAEWVGDITDLSLPSPQLALADAVAATGTPTVVVLLEGRPRLISRIADRVNAIVLGYWPGCAGAQAIAEVLFGEVNPSGRLPITYPRHANALLPYDHKFTDTLDTELTRGPGGFDPQFEFGFGLSYTSFAYEDLQLSAAEMRSGQPLTISITVRNTGARSGAETVLLFTRQHYASITPPVRRLRRFQKIMLESGEYGVVKFTLQPADLTFIDHDGRPRLEPGSYDVLAGPLSATFTVA